MSNLRQIRREIARAASILRGTRTDTSPTALIAELVEEREDYLIQAPAHNTNRRRSAPSPRLQPTMLATQHDFRTWAMANGVPHAPGQTNIPIYSHQLQPNPLGEQQQQTEGDGVAQLQQMQNGIHQQLHATNAEAFARFQQASQALSQANLQQHQAIAAGQQHHTQQQQQFLANLPALLAASTLRNQRPNQPPRRFQQQQDNTYSRNFRQPQHLYQQQQYQHAQQANSSSIGSPTQLSPHAFLHPSTSNMSHMRGHSSQASFSRSINGYRANNSAPTLERRSSWDGGQANTDERAAYAGASSISEAGGQSLPSGPATAPTSPATIGGMLPTFPRHGPSSTASPASTPSPSISTFQAYQNDMNRQQQRGGPPDRYQGYNRLPNYNQQLGQQRGRQNRQRDAYPSPGAPPESLPGPEASSGSPAELAPAQNDAPQTTTDTSISAPEVKAGNVPAPDAESALTTDESALETDDALDPQSIRFGTFDAAFYSSEPAEMAGFGLFDGIPAFDSPAVSLPDQASDLGLPAPDELSLPAPLQSASSAPLPHLRRLGSNNRIATLRYRPGLADIPASPAKRSTPVSPDLSKRPSMHNRRKSAGDEAELALGDITFFGNVPVDKDENARIQAMNALLKEGTKASSLSCTPRKVRRTSTSSSTTNDSSSLLQLANALPSSTSSSASLTSVSTPASPQPESPPHLPPVEILLLSPSSRSTPIPMPDLGSKKSTPPTQNASKASTKQGLSYASLAATPASSQSGKRRGRTGT